MLFNVVTPLFIAAAATRAHGAAVAEPLQERTTNPVVAVCKQIEAAISDASDVYWPRMSSHSVCLLRLTAS